MKKKKPRGDPMSKHQYISDTKYATPNAFFRNENYTGLQPYDY